MGEKPSRQEGVESRHCGLCASTGWNAVFTYANDCGMLLLQLVALASAQAAPISPSTCRLSDADQAWLDRSVAAWNLTRSKALQARAPKALDAHVFDGQCVLVSQTAMAGGPNRWNASKVDGKSVQVGSQTIPVGVVSATIGDAGSAHFVMSTPSVWKAAKVPPGNLGLDVLMTAVMMHEATHVFQMNSYGKAVERLQKEQHLTDAKFSDDAIQDQFRDNAEFGTSIKHEIDLFFAASKAESRNNVLRLGRRARLLMLAREGKFFVGTDAYQRRAEDLWLTLEGSGQWSGLTWLELPKRVGGGGLDHRTAIQEFGRRGDFWSQQLGLAITLTVQRLNPPNWKKRLFRDGRQSLLQILDTSLAAPRARHRLPRSDQVIHR
jgi:hypothetical protein